MQSKNNSSNGKNLIYDGESLSIQIASFLSGLLGKSTEVVVHDVISGEIIWIVNGHITGRETGCRAEAGSVRILMKEAKKNGNPNQLIGYQSTTKAANTARTLRASNLFIRDCNGEPRYAICVNQDITPIKELQQALSFLTEAPVETELSSPNESTVESITTRLILEEIEGMRPFSVDSKDAKMKILKKLNDRGIFEVHRAVPKVCEMLDIAQATLYKYLRELKEDGNNC